MLAPPPSRIRVSLRPLLLRPHILPMQGLTLGEDLPDTSYTPTVDHPHTTKVAPQIYSFVLHSSSASRKRLVPYSVEDCFASRLGRSV